MRKPSISKSRKVQNKVDQVNDLIMSWNQYMEELSPLINDLNAIRSEINELSAKIKDEAFELADEYDNYLSEKTASSPKWEGSEAHMDIRFLAERLSELANNGRDSAESTMINPDRLIIVEEVNKGNEDLLVFFHMKDVDLLEELSDVFVD